MLLVYPYLIILSRPKSMPFIAWIDLTAQVFHLKRPRALALGTSFYFKNISYSTIKNGVRIIFKAKSQQKNNSDPVFL